MAKTSMRTCVELVAQTLTPGVSYNRASVLARCISEYNKFNPHLNHQMRVDGTWFHQQGGAEFFESTGQGRLRLKNQQQPEIIYATVDPDYVADMREALSVLKAQVTFIENMLNKLEEK